MTPSAPIESEPAWAAWYEQREAELVERAISLIRVYQYKMPDGIGPYYHHRAPWPRDWWQVFWDRLEHSLDERDFFLRAWIERNSPGGYQLSIDEVFARDHERCPYIVAGQRDLEDHEGSEAA